MSYSSLITNPPLPLLLLEDSPQDDGGVQTRYSSISPPASPVDQDEPFSTYFEEKVHIPEAPNQVLTWLDHTGCSIEWFDEACHFIEQRLLLLGGKFVLRDLV